MGTLFGTTATKGMPIVGPLVQVTEWIDVADDASEYSWECISNEDKDLESGLPFNTDGWCEFEEPIRHL